MVAATDQVATARWGRHSVAPTVALRKSFVLANGPARLAVFFLTDFRSVPLPTEDGADVDRNRRRSVRASAALDVKPIDKSVLNPPEGTVNCELSTLNRLGFG